MNETIVEKDLADLNGEFWEKLLEKSEMDWKEPDPAIVTAARSLGHPKIATVVAEDQIPFKREVHRRVELELQGLGHLSRIEPSRLALLSMRSMLRHCEAVKRETFQKKNRDYDVEGDIAQTRPMIEAHIRSSLGAEADYLDAFDAKRYGDAAAYLAVIELKRASVEDMALRTEVNNWRMALALAMKDLNMFLMAWNQRVPGTGVIKDRLHRNIEDLLYARLITQFGILPTAEGVRKMSRQGQNEFAEEHTSVFFRGLIEEVSETLLASTDWTEEKFRAKVKEIARRRERIFCSLNPLVGQVQIFWRQ